MARWADAEADSSRSLELKPQNTKALYRRALARLELGKAKDALKDIEEVLKELGEEHKNEDAKALRQRILQAIAPQAEAKAKTKTGADFQPPVREDHHSLRDVGEAEAPQRLTSKSGGATSSSASPSSAPPSSASPSPADAANSRTVIARAAAAARSAKSPAIPTSSPKNSFEMLRIFNAMKRYPDVLAKYVRERVPPQMIVPLFSKAPIETDDLSTLLIAIRTNALMSRVEGDVDATPMPPETVAEYLAQLMRTRSADTSFGMLSNSEKEVLRELLAVLPATPSGRAVHKSVTAVL